MPALWILGILALVIALLLRTRLRVLLSVKNGDWSAEVRAGLVRYRLYPPPEPPKKPRRKKKKPSEKKEAPPPPRRDPLADARRVLGLVKRMWDPLKRALGRVTGALRADPFEIYVTYGGRDEPADAAELCGDTLALVWTVMPVLERVCRMPDPYISVNVDFDAPRTALEADVGLTIRLWALLAAGIPLLIAFVRPRAQS